MTTKRENQVAAIRATQNSGLIATTESGKRVINMEALGDDGPGLCYDCFSAEQVFPPYGRTPDESLPF